uniref:Putative secreted protein n=1 Tax=Rhipicephalus microplus TaxID=6941 RepID=A0A6G5A4P3_RHIMP
MQGNFASFYIFILGKSSVALSTTERSQGCCLKAGDASHVQCFHHLHGVTVHLNDVLLQGRHLGHVVVPPFPLFFLQLDGDAPHWSTLDALHQMSHKTSNLVFNFLLGIWAISSQIRLFVWKSRVSFV